MKKKNKTTHKHNKTRFVCKTCGWRGATSEHKDHSCVLEILLRVPDPECKGHGSTTTSPESTRMKKVYGRSRVPQFYCLHCGSKEFTEPEVEVTYKEMWIGQHCEFIPERKHIAHGKCKKCGKPFDPAEFYKHQANLYKLKNKSK